ncbi:methionine--tRNA ligase subunit beta [Candidatus Parcubacteria bacterium]|nr:MAG: methionine--tRNA ligase subunit beta [Candidatus Parcubacteria bacterium]
MISYEDFKKVDLKTATIEKAEAVEGSEKLVRLEINVGSEKRQIVAGVIKNYPPETLTGKQIIIVANLEPKKLMGLESQGMLLAVDSPDGPILLTPDKKVEDGAIIK